jgi:hypothetical protein
MLTLIRGFDPLKNTLEFGRELILSICDGVAAEIKSLPPCTVINGAKLGHISGGNCSAVSV